MKFMVPACIYKDLADGTVCLPEEFHISLAEQTLPRGSNISSINLKDRHISIPASKLTEVWIGINPQVPNYSEARCGLNAHGNDRIEQKHDFTAYKRR